MAMFVLSPPPPLPAPWMPGMEKHMVTLEGVGREPSPQSLPCMACRPDLSLLGILSSQLPKEMCRLLPGRTKSTPGEGRVKPTLVAVS